MEEKQAVLQMKGICKQFPGTLALNNVDFDVRNGEVHVLLGENGAGKSTLVKIIAGVYRKDSGEILFDGKQVDYKWVKEAQSDGISIIHQELNLLPERTIAQNIYLGSEPMMKGLPFVTDYKKMVQESKALLGSLGLDLNPNTKIKDLSIAQQQMVEVTKALSHNIKLLIMDEPTSSLTKREIDKLFDIIRKLKDEGIAIIYISHRMDEIKRIGDRVTIMRDGQYIDTLEAKTMDMDEAITKMVGRKIENLYHREYNTPGEEALKTENLSGLRFRNVNINVRAGEIVSLSGLVGAGRTEVAKAIFGYDPIEGGKAYLFGKELASPSPKKCVQKGMAFLPEDRKQEGLVLKMPIKENIVMASLKKIFGNNILNTSKEYEIATQYKDRLKIATPDVDKLVMELSGGNQQKVVIGKWLVTDGKFFIFDEPTRGIDIGAKSEIYQLLDDLAHNGAAVLMISSELGEVIGLSDRVYVMYEGDVVAELGRDELSQEAIISYAVGGGGK